MKIMSFVLYAAVFAVFPGLVTAACGGGWAGDGFCECASGYEPIYLNGSHSGHQCVNIDECANKQHICNKETQVCIDTAGSFRCECKPGYQLNRGKCEDIDECKLKRNVCNLDYTECFNEPGSYKCLCREGFAMSKKRCYAINISCALPIRFILTKPAVLTQ